MKKLILFILTISLMSCNANEIDSFNNPYNLPITKNASFPGGNKKLFKFLENNFNYPTKAFENNISGKVYTQFVVEKNGSLTNIKTIRGIGYGCDKEAIRLVKLMPNWIPAEKNDTIIKINYVLPITFKLD